MRPGCSMRALIPSLPPQRCHLSISRPNTRFNRFAQLIATCRGLGQDVATSCSRHKTASPTMRTLPLVLFLQAMTTSAVAVVGVHRAATTSAAVGSYPITAGFTIESLLLVAIRWTPGKFAMHGARCQDGRSKERPTPA
jgi:hypothetical protein